MTLRGGGDGNGEGQAVVRMRGVGAARGDTTTPSRSSARWILAPVREADIAGCESRREPREYPGALAKRAGLCDEAGMMERAHIAVLGAGAWGTALAQTLRLAGRTVTLWARNPALAAEIRERRTNTAYLPGVPLDPALTVTHDLAGVASADLLLLVTPAQETRRMAALLQPLIRPGTPLVICAKGLEQASGKTLVDVVHEVLPDARVAVLSGPSFAADVVRGLPAAVTLACADAALGQSLAVTLGYKNFRIYWTDDVTGVQLGGSVKNVLAIAAGIVAGKGLGASAHAALVTRGAAELRRFGTALGARPETMLGLSGLGDLLLTCGSLQSRNMSLGHALGQGTSLVEILGARTSVSEGVMTATVVATEAKTRGIDMPVCSAVAAIVSGRLDVDTAIEALLSRPFKAED
jgi:glycerol-3-phosphate dehydrogenase (NAD(P)+)